MWLRMTFLFGMLKKEVNSDLRRYVLPKSGVMIETIQSVPLPATLPPEAGVKRYDQVIGNGANAWIPNKNGTSLWVCCANVDTIVRLPSKVITMFLKSMTPSLLTDWRKMVTKVRAPGSQLNRVFLEDVTGIYRMVRRLQEETPREDVSVRTLPLVDTFLEDVPSQLDDCFSSDCFLNADTMRKTTTLLRQQSKLSALDSKRECARRHMESHRGEGERVEQKLSRRFSKKEIRLDKQVDKREKREEKWTEKQDRRVEKQLSKHAV